jgi:uncharacterized protein (DUF4415 family)
MAKKEHIVRASAKELAKRQSQSDWKAAEAMSQDKVERLADEDDGEQPEGWESTVEIGVPEPRPSIHIRVDAEVLRWFKARGPGYQTRINAVLRAFVSARQREGKSGPAPG